VFQTEETDMALDEIAHVPGELPRPHIVHRMTKQREQFRHDNVLTPIAPSPDLPTEIWATSGEVLGIMAASVRYTTDGSLPDRPAQSIPMEPASVEWDIHGGFVTQWCARLPLQPTGTIVRYRIAGWRDYPVEHEHAEPDMWAHDGQGFWFRFPDNDGITTFAYRVEEGNAAPLPAWVTEAVLYQIFLDRFHPGNSDGLWPASADANRVHGGTLRGVRKALPYLDDLGVNCLWLSPVTASPSYHRYDTTDYYTVDPGLGTNEELQALVTEAHGRGMRVIMDFVPTHCSWEHPAFREARRDASSPTASWFTFEERPDRYRMFSGLVPSMPLIDSQNDGARSHLVESAVEWLRACDIDGFRVDHAIGVGMDFYVALREAMLQVKPDVFTVGEVVDTPDCMRRYRNRLDAVLDFPLSRALRQTFAEERWDVRHFASFLTAYHQYMRAGPGRISFLDNHDLNRFLFLAGGNVDRLKLAALCQFTLPATPIIYYGTEIGLSQEVDKDAGGCGGDAEVRRDMPWSPEEQNLELRSFYRRLIRLRRQKPVLWSGAYRTEHVDGDQQTFSYRRYLDDGDEEDVLTVFNLGDAPAAVRLPDGDRARRCLLSSREGVELQRGSVLLPPMSGSILAII
jgi:cyclomaltodextrinase / maltogenic alpha-amylase / neopullulanase